MGSEMVGTLIVVGKASASEESSAIFSPDEAMVVHVIICCVLPGCLHGGKCVALLSLAQGSRSIRLIDTCPISKPLFVYNTTEHSGLH